MTAVDAIEEQSLVFLLRHDRRGRTNTPVGTTTERERSAVMDPMCLQNYYFLTSVQRYLFDIDLRCRFEFVEYGGYVTKRRVSDLLPNDLPRRRYTD